MPALLLTLALESPCIKADIPCRELGLKKADIPCRELGLKKAEISCRKLRLKNGEIYNISPFYMKGQYGKIKDF